MSGQLMFWGSPAVVSLMNQMTLGVMGANAPCGKCLRRSQSQSPVFIVSFSTTTIAGLRVLTKDSPENRSFFGEGVKVVVEVVVDPQRQIDHFDDLGDDLRAAAEPCEKVADVAVVLFDGDGQVFAGEELVIRDEAVIALPIIGDERLAFEADFVEELLACGVITATKNPGDGSPSNRVIGSPKPQFLSLFFTKCHISSRVKTTTSALVDGSGSLRASSRTQFRTATSLTPRMRAMEPKLTLPMA